MSSGQIRWQRNREIIRGLHRGQASFKNACAGCTTGIIKSEEAIDDSSSVAEAEPQNSTVAAELPTKVQI